MNDLQVFNFNENQLRTVTKNGDPWFVAKDVCEVLEIKNTTDAVKRLDDDEVTRFNLGGLSGETNIVNESGLYALVLSSRKPEAKAFKKWITSEVLPSIRKHGAYMTEETIQKAVADPDFIIGLLTKLSENKKMIAIQDQQINELKPKADYLDRILKSKVLVTITQIAKDYGMSGQALNKLLHDKKVQYKLADQWLLYSDIADKNYTSSETYIIEDVEGAGRVAMLTKWTQKGRLFLYDLLKADGILPTIEREA